MKTIECDGDIARALADLRAADPRLQTVIDQVGSIPLRRREPSFASLAAVIVAQQVSKASADAIQGRLERLVDPLDGAHFLVAGEEAWKAAGLSRPKQRTLVALAAAERDGLDLPGICGRDAEIAIEALTALPGIGRWTAETWLLFAGGHPDILPARDLALQGAAAALLGRDGKMAEGDLRVLGEAWRPWRSVAARLLWSYWGLLRHREVAPM